MCQPVHWFDLTNRIPLRDINQHPFKVSAPHHCKLLEHQALPWAKKSRWNNLHMHINHYQTIATLRFTSEGSMSNLDQCPLGSQDHLQPQMFRWRCTTCGKGSPQQALNTLASKSQKGCYDYWHLGHNFHVHICTHMYNVHNASAWEARKNLKQLEAAPAAPPGRFRKRLTASAQRSPSAQAFIAASRLIWSKPAESVSNLCLSVLPSTDLSVNNIICRFI